MRGTTKHLKDIEWEYWCYNFSPNVIVAEKRVKWYDDNRFITIKKLIKRLGGFFAWNESAEGSTKYFKHSTYVEVYFKVDENVSFEEKINRIQPLLKYVDIKPQPERQKRHQN